MSVDGAQPYCSSLTFSVQLVGASFMATWVMAAVGEAPSVLFAWRDQDDVAGAHLLDRPALALNATRAGGARDWSRRGRLDFLGPGPFGCENPRFWVLDFLGFPWILSSESRLINELRGIFAVKFFACAFLPGR
jgi:hypothetical protein